MLTFANRRAFSLIELCVVLAILATLAALLLSGVAQVRAAALRAKCGSNLRQIGLALHQYHEVHRAYPPGCSVAGGFTSTRSLSWQARLLPFIEQPHLWTQSVAAFRIQPNFTEPPHPGGQAIALYHCPSNPLDVAPVPPSNRFVGLTSYLGVAGRNYRFHQGILFPDSQVRATDIRDGTSMTLMVGERPPMVRNLYGWWYAGTGQDTRGSLDLILGAAELNVSVYTPDCPAGPYSFTAGTLSNDCDVFHFWSQHSGGAHFLFADGSVRFLRYGIGAQLSALATRAGGEILDADSLP